MQHYLVLPYLLPLGILIILLVNKFLSGLSVLRDPNVDGGSGLIPIPEIVLSTILVIFRDIPIQTLSDLTQKQISISFRSAAITFGVLLLVSNTPVILAELRLKLKK